MTRTATDSFDIAIVGAGLAGSSAALAAAQHGARVLLIDRATFPREKVCGSCLAESGIDTLRTLCVERVLSTALPLRSVRVSCEGKHAHFPRAAGVAIGRTELDTSLLAEARDAGVVIALGTSARLDRDRTLTLRQSRAEDEPRSTVRATTVIVADGLAGNALDDFAEFAWKISPRSLMGFGAVVPAGSVACDSGEIRMRVAHHGYIGAVLLSSGEIDVAAAIAPSALRAAASVSACARAMLAEDVLHADTLARARWRGTPLLTRRRTCIAAPGILVVGDAAGYIEPFTGEGMTWALVTGALAGTLAATSDAPYRSWPTMYNALMRGPRVRCALLAQALRAPRIVRTLLTLGEAFPAPFTALTASLGRMSSVRLPHRHAFDRARPA